jgi:hypothetical protein
MLKATNFQGKKIYFYCYPPILNGEATYATGYHFYQHSLICLAEGFKDLGIEYYSNVNYWLTNESPDSFLFRYNPKVNPDDCDLIIISSDLFSARSYLPKTIFNFDQLSRKNRSYLIAYVDHDDSVTFPFFEKDLQKINFCFKTHRISNALYPDNFYPWAIGPSERILQQLSDLPSFCERKQQVICNFRPTIFGHHSLRKFIYSQFLPALQSLITVDIAINLDDEESWASANAYDRLMRLQTSSRHVPDYYKTLLSSQCILAFGGYFLSPFPRKHTSLIGRAMRRIVEKLHLKTQYVDQWDSWRFWEALAAGCVPIHLDFDKYGFVLPVMPENWKHYIGIDLEDLDGSIDRIAQNLERLPEISAEGRSWALRHYTPVAVARRFLETVFLK